jgi:Zn-dependent peptidase ImmA (M78 family)/transcriptional regulator with XRE-family HTH domain
MSKTFNPKMISIAREARDLTQTDLASRLAITQGKFSKIESGLLGISEDLVQRLSIILDFPVDFFTQTEPIYGLGGNIIYHHRKRQALSKREIEKIHARIHIRRMHLSKLLRQIEILPSKIELCHIDEYDGGAQEVARAVRAHWMLPPGPIENVTKSIEDAGGMVIQYNFETKLIDAVSQIVPGLPPLFFVNTDLPVDRLRFTLAHELGHLILHNNSIPYPEMEREADAFAAEFLMPAKEIMPMLIGLMFPKLAPLKQYWKASMASLLYQSEHLGAITTRKARSLWMQMGKLGYRSSEPSMNLPIESPSLLQEILDTHRSQLNYSTEQLSALLAIHEHEFRAMYVNARQHLTLVSRVMPSPVRDSATLTG